jgi:flagellar assembly factor FliW
MMLAVELPTQEARSVSEEPAAGEIPVLELVNPLVGFPDLRRFGLARLDEAGTVFDLRCLDDELSFVVVPPAMFFDDYAPEVDDELVEELGAQSEDDLLVLSVVTLGDDPTQATVNLMAPIIVNHRTRRAAQVLLDDATLPLRAPLTPARHATA